MAYHERPVESLRPASRPTSADALALDAAAATLRARRQERLDQARAQMHADVRTRPEDSSPAIRRLLGYDGPAREPRRWEQRIAWGLDGLRLRDVPADAGPPGVARLGSGKP